MISWKFVGLPRSVGKCVTLTRRSLKNQRKRELGLQSLVRIGHSQNYNCRQGKASSHPRIFPSVDTSDFHAELAALITFILHHLFQTSRYWPGGCNARRDIAGCWLNNSSRNRADFLRSEKLDKVLINPVHTWCQYGLIFTDIELNVITDVTWLRELSVCVTKGAVANHCFTGGTYNI